MKDQHLSDEAVAAYADGVLRGHARDRALRHTASCAECNYAVAVQREAVWALRSAAAPALPTALLERLRDVPLTTPIQTVQSALADDGSAMFAAFGTTAAAAFVPASAAPSTSSRSRHLRPLMITTAAVAAASVLTVGSVSASGQNRPAPSTVSRPLVANGSAVPAP